MHEKPQAVANSKRGDRAARGAQRPLTTSARRRRLPIVTRQLSVYDGQRWLGTLTERSGGVVAKDTDGREVGTFNTVKEAADAISRNDATQIGR